MEYVENYTGVDLVWASVKEIFGAESMEDYIKIGGYRGTVNGKPAIILPASKSDNTPIRIPSLNDFDDKEYGHEVIGDITDSLYFILEPTLHAMYSTGGYTGLCTDYALYRVERLLHGLSK